jgi:hypothetical protein
MRKRTHATALVHMRVRLARCGVRRVRDGEAVMQGVSMRSVTCAKVQQGTVYFLSDYECSMVSHGATPLDPPEHTAGAVWPL